LPARKFLDWLDAPKNLKWIDVGCGNGAFTEVLIARCAPAAVTGVDPSEASSVTPAPGREQSAPSFALPTPRPYRFLTTVSTPPPWRWLSSSFPIRGWPRANWCAW